MFAPPDASLCRRRAAGELADVRAARRRVTRPHGKERSPDARSPASPSPTRAAPRDGTLPMMPGAAIHSRATLTLDYLCSVLERAGLITDEQRREAVARGDLFHARLLRQRATGPRKRGASVGEGVHPAE